MVSIKSLKSRISSKYPDSKIAGILKAEPDEVSPEELIAKIGTWQFIIDEDAKK